MNATDATCKNPGIHGKSGTHDDQNGGLGYVQCEICANFTGLDCEAGHTVSKNPLEERLCGDYVGAEC